VSDIIRILRESGSGMQMKLILWRCQHWLWLINVITWIFIKHPKSWENSWELGVPVGPFTSVETAFPLSKK